MLRQGLYEESTSFPGKEFGPSSPPEFFFTSDQLSRRVFNSLPFLNGHFKDAYLALIHSGISQVKNLF